MAPVQRGRGGGSQRGGGSGQRRGGQRRGGQRGGRRRERRKEDKVDWIPTTKLGRLVKEQKITNMSETLQSGLPLREPEIVDILLPDMDEEVLDVNMVQRMTDSGRRVRYAITTVVGNSDGYVGVSHIKGKEVGPTIRKSIDAAKLNIIEVKRGCGSWECGCMKPHTVPITIKGKCSSTEVTLKPAPHGIGLAAGNISKHILRLAGIKDIWVRTKGETRTTVNYAKACFDALKRLNEVKMDSHQSRNLGIVSGFSKAIPVKLAEPELEEEIDNKEKEKEDDK